MEKRIMKADNKIKKIAFLSTLILMMLFDVSILMAKDKISQLIEDKNFSELAKIGKPAVEPLIFALKDDDWKVREGIISTLGKIGEPAVEPLIKDLREKGNNFKWDTAHALGKIGEPAVKPLAAAFKYKDKDVHQYGAIALGVIGDSRAVESLSDILKKNESAKVRRWAAWALGRIKDEAAVKQLSEALSDNDFNVRKHATLALAEIKAPETVENIILGLGDRNWEVRRASALALGNIKDDIAVIPLIASFKDDESEVRDEAKRALGKIGEPAVELLIAALDDENLLVRKYAAKALGTIKAESSVEPLIKKLNDKKSKIRKSAVSALGGIEDEKAIRELVNVLKKDNPAIRNSVTFALIKTGAPSVSHILKDAKQDKSIREQAITFLGELGDAQAVDFLIGMSYEKNFNVRKAATKALGRINDDKTIAPLVARINDDDEFTRYYAAEALKNKGWKAKEGTEKIKYLISLQNWPELASIKEPAVKQLVDALNDKSEHFTIRVVETLGEIGDKSAVSPLIDSFKDDGAAYNEAVGKSLNKLTGEDFGPEAKEWKKWREGNPAK
jgi:HEAT repeat protein